MMIKLILGGVVIAVCWGMAYYLYWGIEKHCGKIKKNTEACFLTAFLVFVGTIMLFFMGRGSFFGKPLPECFAYAGMFVFVACFVFEQGMTVLKADKETT